MGLGWRPRGSCPSSSSHLRRAYVVGILALLDSASNGRWRHKILFLFSNPKNGVTGELRSDVHGDNSRDQARYPAREFNSKR